MKLLAYTALLLLAGCVGPRGRKGLVRLPSEQEAEITRLQAENQRLTIELSETQHNCRGVLEVFHKAGAYSRSPQAKEK